MKALLAQTRTELTLAFRQGEQLLVSLGIPLMLLVFLSQVSFLPTGTEEAIDYLAPATMGLAVMSSAMVSLGIGTGFERHYGVLKRLGATPLGRPRLLAAKVIATLVVEALQLVLIVSVAVALGWDPSWRAGRFVAALVLGTAAFAGLGLSLAGRLSGPANLAACNGLYLLLLLFGGVAVPAGELPGPLGAPAKLLPTGALVDLMRAATGSGGVTPSLVVLAVWAVLAPTVAARTFRWTPAV